MPDVPVVEESDHSTETNLAKRTLSRLSRNADTRFALNAWKEYVKQARASKRRDQRTREPRAEKGRPSRGKLHAVDSSTSHLPKLLGCNTIPSNVPKDAAELVHGDGFALVTG